jgi:hypothetical protein
LGRKTAELNKLQLWPLLEMAIAVVPIQHPSFQLGLFNFEELNILFTKKFKSSHPWPSQHSGQ